MKILIIGKNSYIGNHLDEWLTSNGHGVEQRNCSVNPSLSCRKMDVPLSLIISL